jgi:hypothetical protein
MAAPQGGDGHEDDQHGHHEHDAHEHCDRIWLEHSGSPFSVCDYVLIVILMISEITVTGGRIMIELFRHDSWATIRLLEFCRDLDPALLKTGAASAYGPIKETLAGRRSPAIRLPLGKNRLAAGRPPPRPGLLADDVDVVRLDASDQVLGAALGGHGHPQYPVARDRLAAKGRLSRIGTDHPRQCAGPWVPSDRGRVALPRSAGRKDNPVRKQQKPELTEVQLDDPPEELQPSEMG